MDKSEPKSKKSKSTGHGGGIRGDNSAPRWSSFEERFGRMFPGAHA